ncbi:hypothetical protein IFM89_010589 [Coptis chinensis]|uniref:Reverse transcriptase domain-containing protein n=1 Tax=Coptis chinensis TaxID=261450 RepID=A0A835M540_9MAGN|nr:hypothetical protein IFM89_010589 [Coptis chinensis]
MDIEYDRNTKYFHALVNINRNKAMITEFKNSQGELFIDQDEIDDLLVQQYTKKFKKVNHELEMELISMVHCVISHEDKLELTKFPTAEEIKAAIFYLHVESVPGPNGFNGFFYQKCWKIVGHNLTRAIHYFFKNSRVPMHFNSNFLVLIPKERNATELNRIISLCLANFPFKVITKLMTSRLGIIAKKVVFKQQYRFIAHRNSNEAIRLASELVNELKVKRHRRNMGLKLDIRQAFDSLD